MTSRHHEAALPREFHQTASRCDVKCAQRAAVMSQIRSGGEPVALQFGSSGLAGEEVVGNGGAGEFLAHRP